MIFLEIGKVIIEDIMYFFEFLFYLLILFDLELGKVCLDVCLVNIL